MSNRVREIQQEEAERAGISVSEMLGPCRLPQYVGARNRGMFRASELGLSTTQIGRLFNRHHTTVLHALGRLSRSYQ